MPTAKRLPSGSWRCRVYAGKDQSGKHKYESFTASTKKEAEALAAQWALRQSSRPQDQSVGDALDAYISTSDGVLSPSTVKKYRSMAHCHFDVLRPLPLRRLTSAQVQSWISALAAKKSPKTVACVYGLLTAALAQAAPDLALRVRLPRRLPHEITIPTTAQVRALIDASDDILRPVLVIASTMGLRRAEISALTWSDVQRDASGVPVSLRINKAYVKGPDNLLVLHAPKTNAGIRSVEIPPAAAPYLQRPDGALDTDRVTPLSPDAITRRFERLTARLSLPGLRFHSLRHYYDSALLALGVPDKYIMARMGHATPNMTKQVYQHLLAEKDADVTARISNFFSDI